MSTRTNERTLKTRLGRLMTALALPMVLACSGPTGLQEGEIEDPGQGEEPEEETRGLSVAPPGLDQIVEFLR